MLLLELGQNGAEPELQHLHQPSILFHLGVELGLCRFPRGTRRRLRQDFEHALATRDGIGEIGRRLAQVFDRLGEELSTLPFVRLAEQNAVALDEAEPRAKV